jgi:hypothetical protein
MQRKLDRFAFTRVALPAIGLGLSFSLFVNMHAQTSTVGSITGIVRDSQGCCGFGTDVPLV